MPNEEIKKRVRDCLEPARSLSEHVRAMEDRAPKKLRVGSFAVHSARGLIREQRTRRWSMFAALLVALLLLCAGSTFLQPMLVGHPVWFLCYWLACACMTLLSVLLALFDVLMLRAEVRGAREKLHSNLSPNERSDE